jgi:hypothetical protein
LLQCEIELVNVALENKSEVEPTKELAEVPSSTGQLQTAERRKFKEDGCKELMWLTFNHTMGIVSC